MVQTATVSDTAIIILLLKSVNYLQMLMSAILTHKTAQNRLHVLILKAVLAVCVTLGFLEMVSTATVSICYPFATS